MVYNDWYVNKNQLNPLISTKMGYSYYPWSPGPGQEALIIIIIRNIYVQEGYFHSNPFSLRIELRFEIRFEFTRIESYKIDELRICWISSFLSFCKILSAFQLVHSIFWYLVIEFYIPWSLLIFILLLNFKFTPSLITFFEIVCKQCDCFHCMISYFFSYVT